MDYLNREALFLCDYDRLSDREYQKQFLRQITDKFREIYGADELSEDMEFVIVPAVIKPDCGNELFIGIVQFDLTSSGEHYGTDFFTSKYGVLNVDNEELSAEARQYLKKLHPYEYYPTVPFSGDIHVDWSKCTDEVREIIEYCNIDTPEQSEGMVRE